VPHGDDPSMYSLKWFNPDSEVDICGHATLATAHILFDLPETRGIQSLTFYTRSGVMKAAQTEAGLVELDFPADDLVELQGEERSGAEKAVTAAIRGQGRVKAIYLGRWYLTAELVMDVDVDLANVDVDPNELVSQSSVLIVMHTSRLKHG
jgi:predicted PhzF superfamily epimerase YddE/YHI9